MSAEGKTQLLKARVLEAHYGAKVRETEAATLDISPAKQWTSNVPSMKPSTKFEGTKKNISALKRPSRTKSLMLSSKLGSRL